MFWKRGLRESLPEVAGACYCMAAIDGEVTVDEVRMIRDALLEFSGGEPSRAVIERLIEDARAQVRHAGLEGYLKGFGTRLDDETRETVLAAAGATLVADGKVHPNERALFLRLSEGFGFSAADANDLLERVIAAGSDVTS